MSTLFLVHAHPDDEAISTGGIMARAHDQGRRVVLVTCTRGELGEIHNMDEALTRPRLGEVRTEEMARAGRILGVDRQEFLGYRDSGMAGTAGNEDPASFHRAPLLEAAQRLAGLLREERPDVVVTYGPDGQYGHPDHVKAHHVTVAALDLLAAEGWRPAKAYHCAIPRSFVARMAEQVAESYPDDPGVRQMASLMQGIPDEEITTIVDVAEHLERKRQAFAAHVSQNNPASPFQTAAGQIFEAAFSREAYVLARGALGEESPERDVFDGIPG